MRASRLWQELEAIGGAAPQRDWAQALGDDWAVAGALLHATGDKAEELICPKSSENGCLRQVVRVPGGGLRAECGDIPRRCEHLTLKPEEVKILAIHVGRLCNALRWAFDLQDARTDFVPARVHRLGRYELRAGVGFPVFLGLPERGQPLALGDMGAVTGTPGPKALLVPYPSAVEKSAIAQVAANDVGIFQLDDVVMWDAKRTLAPRFDPMVLFRSIIEKLPGALSDAGDAVARPVMNLPVGTRWGDLRFAFVSGEVLNVSYCKQPPKRIEPDLLGMKDERNGKATRQWRLLQMCAALGGALPRSFPVQTIRGQRLDTGAVKLLGEIKSGYDRQRQLLTKTLKARFGIDEDPFTARDDCYVAKFIVDAGGLKQGRADQRGRNFVDGD